MENPTLRSKIIDSSGMNMLLLQQAGKPIMIGKIINNGGRW
jgi:hypothetical protein